MNKKKIMAIILIIFGAALILGAITFWIDTLTSSQPAGLGVNLRDWISTIAGLGASISGWITLFKKDKGATRTEIKVSDSSPQFAMGEQSRNIQAPIYIENLKIDSPENIPSPDKIRQAISPTVDFKPQKRKSRKTNQDDQCSVTISYSHADRAFVNEMEKHLNEIGIQTWRDIHDATAGRLEKMVDRAMRQNPLVLLILSKDSVKSDWVEHEARIARSLEKELGRDVLCPIALDEAWKDCSWPAVLREQIMDYNILDFSRWEDSVVFDEMFGEFRCGTQHAAPSTRHLAPSTSVYSHLSDTTGSTRAARRAGR